jgi:hypothetical protein
LPARIRIVVFIGLPIGLESSEKRNELFEEHHAHDMEVRQAIGVAQEMEVIQEKGLTQEMGVAQEMTGTAAVREVSSCSAATAVRA